MAIYSGFSQIKWWCSIVMLVYQAGYIKFWSFSFMWFVPNPWNFSSRPGAFSSHVSFVLCGWVGFTFTGHAGEALGSWSNLVMAMAISEITWLWIYGFFSKHKPEIWLVVSKILIFFHDIYFSRWLKPPSRFLWAYFITDNWDDKGHNCQTV